MKHLPQLDSLRGIAVLLVILSHWLPNGNSAFNIFLGNAGVNIFFVLSGFLITRILLDLKEKREANNSKTFKLMFAFYMRRTIRIFPIYYITVIILWLLGSSSGTN